MVLTIIIGKLYFVLDWINFAVQSNYKNSSEVISAGASFSGTVLAIFFTLISLPVQNILSKYSQDLIDRVKSDLVLVLSFIFLTFVFCFNLVALAIASNTGLVIISLGLSLSSSFILALLVIHTFYLLDARNQLNDITNNIKKQIVGKIKKSEYIRDKKLTPIKRLINRDKSIDPKDTDKVLSKFSVEESVIVWLKESTEIVFDVIQSAVQANRFEVVESGLKNIADLANKYIISRKEYSTEQDGFISYLNERLIDIKNIIKDNAHPKIMLSVAKTAKDIAISSLTITPIRSFAGENFIPLGFINILSDICLSKEILKETSYAPISCIDFLVEIGKNAVLKKFPRTVSLVTDKLGEIAVKTTKLHFLYADILSGRANWGLSTLLGYLLEGQNLSNFSVEYETESIIKNLEESVKTYFIDEKTYHYTTRSNIKPLFGPMSVQQSGIASVFVRSLQLNYDQYKYNVVVKSLDELLSDLIQCISTGLDSFMFNDVNEILDHIYMIGIAFLPIIKARTDLRDKSLSMLKIEFLYPFTNAISGSFVANNSHYIPDSEYMNSFFSLLGIMFYENKDKLFDEIIDLWISKIIEIINENKIKVVTEHEGKMYENHEITFVLSNLYRYLRLSGIWLCSYMPKNKLLKTVISMLKEQSPITRKDNSFGILNNYPEDDLGGVWLIKRPYMPYGVKYFSDLDNALFGQDIRRKFEAEYQKAS